MRGKSKLVLACGISCDPFAKFAEEGILLGGTGPFVWFPGPSVGVGQADLDPRIEKDHLLGVRSQSFHDVGIAAFNDPGRMIGPKCIEGGQGVGQGPSGLVVVPGDGVKCEHSLAGLSKMPSQSGFSRSRVPKNQNSVRHGFILPSGGPGVRTAVRPLVDLQCWPSTRPRQCRPGDRLARRHRAGSRCSRCREMD